MHLEYSEFDIYKDMKSNVDFITQDIKDKMKTRQRLAELALWEHDVQSPSAQDVRERPDLGLVGMDIDQLGSHDLLDLSEQSIEERSEHHRESVQQQMSILKEAQDYLERIVQSIDLIREGCDDSEAKAERGIDALEHIKHEISQRNFNNE